MYRYVPGGSAVPVARMHRLRHEKTRYGWAVRCGLAGVGGTVAWVSEAATAPYRRRGGLGGEKPGSGWEARDEAEAKKPGFWSHDGGDCP